MKFLSITENKITKGKNKGKKGKNNKNVPHLEITEVLLVHCNIANHDYQHNSRVLYILFLVNHLVNY